LSNVGARTERGRGGTGRNSLFEGELVVGLLDLGRVSILLDPAEFASIREKAGERGEKRACGGDGGGLPEEVVAVVLVAVDGVGCWEEEGGDEEEEADGEGGNGSHGGGSALLLLLSPARRGAAAGELLLAGEWEWEEQEPGSRCGVRSRRQEPAAGSPPPPSRSRDCGAEREGSGSSDQWTLDEWASKRPEAHVGVVSRAWIE
jgi:hypothetical protein